MNSNDRAVAVGEPPLGAEQLEVLRTVAEHLVPAGHGMPSARDIVTTERVQFVLDSRPDLLEPLLGALRVELGSAPGERIERLAAQEPVHHMAVQLVIVGAYYTDARVRELLHYPGQMARPVNAHEFPQYIADGLIDAVLARGQIWRDPSDAAQGRS